MDYRETVEYLYSCTPQFQVIGASAYKPGLGNARALDNAFGSPHRHFKSIHIAGTNGKGSTAHTLAALLQSAGYKVGLYTSPHLVDFRERIRVNGEKISQEGVVDFVERYRHLEVGCQPSFFELTTIMAFDWFARQHADVAVIETGLGGRLDTTNIITPVLSVITNISLDHVAQLGNTPESIAREKAGIIKPGVPTVIGEAAGEVARIFIEKAAEVGSPISFACEHKYWTDCRLAAESNSYIGTRWGDIEAELTGECQMRNAATILCAADILGGIFKFDAADVRTAFLRVVGMTGLMGRWTVLGENPLTVCDTGHNVGGWEYTQRRLGQMPRPLSMVIGFVSDKDVDHILPMMPVDAQYYFTQASIPRAMDAHVVAERAARHGLHGVVVSRVKDAVAKASTDTQATGSIFIGGSTFVVADLLSGQQ